LDGAHEAYDESVKKAISEWDILCSHPKDQRGVDDAAAIRGLEGRR
jgi:hypothetical protein